MTPKEAHPDKLTDPIERAIAKLARIARWDTINGGTRALVLLDHMKRSPNYDRYHTAISNVYAFSNRTVCGHGAFECPECGNVVFGIEAAYTCCTLEDPESHPHVFETVAERILEKGDLNQ